MPLFATALAITFDCQFAQITWNTIGSSYTCVTIPSDIESNRSLTSVTGNHLSGYSNVDVRAIYITECRNLTFIPQRMGNFFPNVAGLVIDFCGISTLNGNDLNGHNNLQWISLINNDIEHIPGDFFSQNSNMSFAHFNQNMISSVGENLLISLESFQLAHFWENVCINDGANQAAFIPNLIMNLRNNCAVPEDTTTPIPSTTTTLSTTTSSTSEPTCDINETICDLQMQNENLLHQNAEMKEKLDYLSKKLDSITELIIELSTRPCGL